MRAEEKNEPVTICDQSGKNETLTSRNVTLNSPLPSFGTCTGREHICKHTHRKIKILCTTWTTCTKCEQITTTPENTRKTPPFALLRMGAAGMPVGSEVVE